MNIREYLADETAGKLISAGMRLFGEYGFKGTTTRMIAREAESNIGSIAYYFGNKRSFYLAIVSHIAERMRERFRLDMISQKESHMVGLTAEDAHVILKGMVRNMIQTFVVDDEASCWLLLVMREQANPTEAFDILYNEVFDSVYRILSRLIAVLAGLEHDHIRATLEAHTLIGQVVFFLVGRSSIVRRLGGKDGYSQEVIEIIEETILSHVNFFTRENFASEYTSLK
ncbi:MULTISPECIES: CerR family C-terminal domain-containing protein [unclassified Microbulbifer]|uniref:CerR family C-terminal domain-containing protein n=1 Tax=unclassified Microbulbifer TaxID=2619833 RepID=UPI0027E4D824|nr:MULTISPECIES: CerR family C-terminal domain-containing protein [unclassified Microbulbifer]